MPGQWTLNIRTCCCVQASILQDWGSLSSEWTFSFFFDNYVLIFVFQASLLYSIRKSQSCSHSSAFPTACSMFSHHLAPAHILLLYWRIHLHSHKFRISIQHSHKHLCSYSFYFLNERTGNSGGDDWRLGVARDTQLQAVPWQQIKGWYTWSWPDLYRHDELTR